MHCNAMESDKHFNGSPIKLARQDSFTWSEVDEDELIKAEGNTLVTSEVAERQKHDTCVSSKCDQDHAQPNKFEIKNGSIEENVDGEHHTHDSFNMSDKEDDKRDIYEDALSQDSEGLKTNHQSEDKQQTTSSCQVCVPIREEDLVQVNSRRHHNASSGTERRTRSRRKRHDLNKTPLDGLRYGSLYVTDLTQQFWCEQQMVYELTGREIPVESVPKVIEKVKLQKKGKVIHEAREKEVQIRVPVKATSREDIFAIKFINIMHALDGFHVGRNIAREIPIMGFPFEQNVFISGIIDEIRIDPVNGELDIVEFKTRKSQTAPSKAQRRKDEMQVMIYKIMFDDLILKRLPKDKLASHLHLNFNAKLGVELCNYHKGNTLNEMWFSLLDLAGAATCINQGFVEYGHQKSKETVAVFQVEFDDNWIKKQVVSQLDYWKGNRKEVFGISDIEDIWKCSFCVYNRNCDWLELKSEEIQKRKSMEENC